MFHNEDTMFLVSISTENNSDFRTAKLDNLFFLLRKQVGFPWCISSGVMSESVNVPLQPTISFNLVHL